MKKLFYITLAAMTALAGCSEPKESGPQTVDTLTANVQNGVLTLDPGETFQLVFNSSPAKDATISLHGVKPEIATIDENFLVTGIKGGSYSLTVRATKGETHADVDFTVKVRASVESISIKAGSETLQVGIGATLDLSDAFVVLPAIAENPTLRYESDNTALATVDENTGIVTGVAEGTAKVRAQSTDGTGVYSDYINVLVSADAVSTPLSKTGWSATASSAQNNYAAQKVINDVKGGAQSYWWTNTIRRPPHWVLVDMKEVKSFNKIDIFRPTAWAYAKTVEIWISEKDEDGVGEGDASFAKFGEVTFPSSDTSETEQSLNLYPAVSSARYVKLLMTAERGSYETSNFAPVAIDEIDLYLIQ